MENDEDEWSYDEEPHVSRRKVCYQIFYYYYYYHYYYFVLCTLLNLSKKYCHSIKLSSLENESLPTPSSETINLRFSLISVCISVQ
ncbi:unnamed protein product [Schistosoma margrebowiei]|uniref:Uncharacterized protein n=1 Tax=Schistosoma margrebowiei TaxID=48269 RepID=A0A183LE67_9TREM|nr:unnamed protein product [Schistosoma margrebowiei]